MPALFWIASAIPSWAVPADPTPFTFVQPDGTRILLRTRGDEFFHWHEDMNGYTVIRQENRFVYAQLDANQQLSPGTALVGEVQPASLGLTPHLLPPPDLRPPNRNDNAPLYRPWLTKSSGKAVGAMAQPYGTVKNLVILCRFPNHGDWTMRPREEYDTLFNKVGGDPVIAPYGSVKDAYRENSYNTLTVQSTVLTSVTLPHDEDYYAATNSGTSATEPNTLTMVKDALALVDPMVNFGDFDDDNDGFIDMIDFIHSGHGAEWGGVNTRIWSHKSALPSPWESADTNALGVKVKVQPYHTEPALAGSDSTDIVEIGVICHESGHFFGLPDLYDTDNSSQGVGAWCLMAGNWGAGLPPPHLSAWCKVTLGWIVPGVPVSRGTYSLAQVETSPAVIKITKGFPAGEYLLIENREPVGLDAAMPQGGIAVWHIDETMSNNKAEGYPTQYGWPQNGKHYKVALLQADGQYLLERNLTNGTAAMLYRNGTNSYISSKTVPSTDAYQGGTVFSTFNTLSHISDPGAVMYLNYSYYDHVLYVDKFSANAVQDGSRLAPYKSVANAYNAATDGDTILIKHADHAEAPLIMNKRVNFDTIGGDVRIH